MSAGPLWQIPRDDQKRKQSSLVPPQHVIDYVGENGNTGTVKEEQ